MAQGELGHVGIGRQTAFGTAVSVTDYAAIDSETLSARIDRVMAGLIAGRFGEPTKTKGLTRVEGEITTKVHPVEIGHFLHGALNTVSGSVVLSGFLWSLRFSPTQSDFSTISPLTPYTLEVFRDVTSAFRYHSALFGRLEIGVQAGQAAMARIGMVAQAEGIVAKTTPSFHTADPFAFDAHSISIAGSGIDIFEEFSVAIDQQLEGIPTLNNTSTISRVRRRGHQQVRVSGMIDLARLAEYGDFVNQTQQLMRMSFFRAPSHALVITVPRLVWTSFPANLGTGRISARLEGEGDWDPTSSYAVDYLLTTVKSNY